MRILIALFLSLSINSYEFKSYEAKFQFQARGFNFPLNRYFAVEGNEINTRVKMNVFFYTYSIDSDFAVDGSYVISKKTTVKDPFRDEPKKFSLVFDGENITSNELGNIASDTEVLEQLASDVQVRLNAANGVNEYSLSIFDNTKGKVIKKNYKLTGKEEVTTPFGPINTIVVEATADEVGPIIYYIAPEFDYLIIQSQAILKNGDKRILSIKERPKFLAE
ncbi:MAG: hypothetical protein ISP93_03135 [SAR86 cluster bacterium]|jgi:hypothetical protein|nr:hypothetical protein [SAR86 cluster bacterium]MBL6811127.1 hypothetical protein [SAR86 cluster bacterium]